MIDLLDNISKGKATYQSSTFDIQRELPSKLAVDGSTYGNARTLDVSKLSCSHTAIQLNPWWKVGAIVLVIKIKPLLKVTPALMSHAQSCIGTNL